MTRLWVKYNGSNVFREYEAAVWFAVEKEKIMVLWVHASNSLQRFESEPAYALQLPMN